MSCEDCEKELRFAQLTGVGIGVLAGAVLAYFVLRFVKSRDG